MVAVDYVVIGIIGISALIGLSRGFVREVFSLVLWVVAVMLALGFSDRVAAALPKTVEGVALRYAAAFAIVFVSALLIGSIMQWLLAQLVQTTGLTGTDRLLGLVFGGLRGAVLCIVAMIALRPFAGEQAWWRASKALPVLGAFESNVTAVISSAGEWVGRLRQKQ